jgi:hypothetical protein
VKLPQERIGEALEHINIGNNFLDRTPIAQQLRQSIDKWECIKLKGFCTVKETVIRLKKACKNERKSLLSIHLTRDYNQNMQGVQKLTLQRINNPWNKWDNKLNTQFSKKKYRGLKIHEKMFSIVGHTGNVNQNDTEILLHANQNGYLPSIEQTITNLLLFFPGCREKRNLYPFLVGM